MEYIQRLFTLLQSLSPIWKAITIVLLCSVSGLLLFFATSCGVSRVILNNSQSDNNNTSIDVNANPHTSTDLDSLTFKPKN